MSKRPKTLNNSHEAVEKMKRRRVTACEDDSDEERTDYNDEHAENIENIENFASPLNESQQEYELALDPKLTLHGVLGHIQSIRLVDFMCHEDFMLELGPRLNFIQGANGSGKSAIINGILLALGARASITNRGIDLASFIRTNQHKAKVILKICNYLEGCDEVERYKPELFGRSIIIERAINSSGVSSYKICDERNKTISTKKEEVDNIVKHFDILLDNPITMLTQEVSKNFLNSQNPAQKYKFFSKATQLESIKNEYDASEEIRFNVVKKLNEKKEVLRIKEKEMNQLTEKLKVIEIVNGNVDKSDQLNKEMLFAHVNNTRSSIQEIEKEFHSQERRCQRSTDAVDRIDASIESLMARKADIKEKMDELQSALCGGDMQELTANVNNAARDVHQSQTKLERLKKEVDGQTYEYNDIKRRINELENREKIDFQDVLEQLKTEIEGDQEKHKDLCANQQALNAEMQQLSEKAQDTKRELGFADDRIKNLYGKLNDAKRGTRNRIERYGQRFPELLQQIDCGKFQKKPIGPIGEYLDIQDEQAIVAAEVCLGTLIRAFVVDNGQDQKELQRIFTRVFGEHHHPEVIMRPFKPQMHDVRKNEVRHPEYSSMLNILRPKDVNVANALIDQNNLETVLFVPDFNVAQNMLIDINTVPKNCTLALTRDGDQMYPQTHTSDFKCYPRQARGARVLVKDMQQVIESMQREIQGYKDERAQVEAEYQNIEKAKKDCYAKKMGIEQQISELRKRIRANQTKQSDLSSNQETDNELNVLKEELADVVKELEQLNNDTEQVEAEHQAFTEVLRNAQQEVDQLNQQRQEAYRESEPLKEEMEAFENQLAQYQRQRRETEAKKAADLAEKQRLEVVLSSLNDKLLNQERIALEKNGGKLIVTDRVPEDIKKEMNYVEKILQEHQNYLDAEEQLRIRNNYLQTKSEYDHLRKDMLKMDKHVKQLSDGLAERINSFVQLRYYIALITNIMFEDVLAKKGFSGEINVVYDAPQQGGAGSKGKTLDIVIRPRNERQLLSQESGGTGISYSSTKSLSGGERSFSTVAFIIALWAVCPSPFRCLDEVDVFMDSITRKLSLDTLIEYSATKSAKQFIFFTPLRMQHSQLMEYTKVFQMPEIVRK